MERPNLDTDAIVKKCAEHMTGILYGKPFPLTWAGQIIPALCLELRETRERLAAAEANARK